MTNQDYVTKLISSLTKEDEPPSPNLTALPVIAPAIPSTSANGTTIVSVPKSSMQLLEPKWKATLRIQFKTVDARAALSAYHDLRKKYLIERSKELGVLTTLGSHKDYEWTQDTMANMEEIDNWNYKKQTRGKLTPQQTYGFFITVSPEPDTVNYYDLIQCIEAIMKKKGCKDAYAVLEQNGTGDPLPLGYHPHFHMLVKLNKMNQNGQPRRFYNGVRMTCLRFKTKSEAFLQIKAVSEKNFQNKLDYINGKKTDPAKQKLVLLDRIWRDDNKIPQIFTKISQTPLAEI